MWSLEVGTLRPLSPPQPQIPVSRPTLPDVSLRWSGSQSLRKHPSVNGFSCLPWASPASTFPLPLPPEVSGRLTSYGALSPRFLSVPLRLSLFIFPSVSAQLPR